MILFEERRGEAKQTEDEWLWHIIDSFSIFGQFYLPSRMIFIRVWRELKKVTRPAWSLEYLTGLDTPQICCAIHRPREEILTVYWYCYDRNLRFESISPPSASHTQIVLSLDQDTKRVPLEERKAGNRNNTVCPVSIFGNLSLSSAPRIRISSSSDPDRTCLPSGEYATECTQPIPDTEYLHSLTTWYVPYMNFIIPWPWHHLFIAVRECNWERWGGMHFKWWIFPLSTLHV